jgi:hypothetical protein
MSLSFAIGSGLLTLDALRAVNVIGVHRLVLLRPLSYLGAARPLMLPLYHLLPYLYLPDRSTAYTGLTSAVAAISMLSSYRPNTSTSVRTMPTFLIRLAFPTFI